FSCATHCARHDRRNVHSSKFLRHARRILKFDTLEMKYWSAIESLTTSRVDVRNTRMLILCFGKSILQVTRVFFLAVNILTLLTDYLLFTQWLIKGRIIVDGLRHSS